MSLSQDSVSTSGATARSVILVVEDEAMLALELEQVLTDAGHEVVLAADGRGALAYAADPNLCLRAAVLDLHFPFGMDGREIIHCLRGRSPGLPVIVVTGYDPLAPQADLRGIGGPTTRLEKPVQPDRLLQRIGEAMASTSGVA